MDKNKKQMSKHFTNFILKGEKFDFNSFKTQEEFDAYEKEVKEYLEANKGDLK
ncbi:hypothetical protein [Viridibacillus arvi]|uniref:hypothetical protein n=1 Tax=Viridibacillus arvi TaxID=263475 RepID=UPI0034CF1DAC